MTARSAKARVAAGSSAKQVQRPVDHTAPEQPEHLGDRRRFLVWALMLGATTPDRLTERIVAEIDDEVRT